MRTERSKEKMRHYRHGRRRVAIALYGGKCARCGFSDIRALAVDHVNGGGKAHKRATKDRLKFWRQVIREKNSQLYQVLCFNCNSIKQWEHNEWGSNSPCKLCNPQA